MKAALLCELAAALETQFGLASRATEQHVDVHLDGYALRMWLWSDRDEANAGRAAKVRRRLPAARPVRPACLAKRVCVSRSAVGQQLPAAASRRHVCLHDCDAASTAPARPHRTSHVCDAFAGLATQAAGARCHGDTRRAGGAAAGGGHVASRRGVWHAGRAPVCVRSLPLGKALGCGADAVAPPACGGGGAHGGFCVHRVRPGAHPCAKVNLSRAVALSSRRLLAWPIV